MKDNFQCKLYNHIVKLMGGRQAEQESDFPGDLWGYFEIESKESNII